MLLKFVTNGYFIITAIFLASVLFFANNDLITQYKDQKELNALKAKIQYLESEIARMKAEEKKLTTDTNAIIKYAREKYLMKKPNEEVFVIDTVKK
jgi:cell division protein FtsB